jgi:splicing factor 3B subunit 3
MKTSLTPGGTEVILYTTISGTIGVLVPFTSREDVDLFSHLEMAMRQQKLSLIGRDHLSFRSYYAPCKVFPEEMDFV